MRWQKFGAVADSIAVIRDLEVEVGNLLLLCCQLSRRLHPGAVRSAHAYASQAWGRLPKLGPAEVMHA